MSSGYQIYDQYGTYYLTFTIVDWVDVFSTRSYRDVLIDSFKYCIEKKGFLICGFVIMSNHVYVLVPSENGSLSDTIRDLKKFTSRKIVEMVQNEPESRREWLLHRFKWNASQRSRNGQFQVWTHENPVRAGIVAAAGDYIYSSAKALMEGRDIHFRLCTYLE